jgi:hypothetical protein
MFLEMKIGSLEVGNKADMTNWDRHLYSPAMDDIKNMSCVITPSDGGRAYRFRLSGEGPQRERFTLALRYVCAPRRSVIKVTSGVQLSRMGSRIVPRPREVYSVRLRTLYIPW